jgi:hypothetical protein
MKNRFKSILIPVAISTLVMTGCSKLPQVEIDAANAAIEEVNSAGADLYVPELYIALQDSMSAVMIQAEAQDSKLIKNYSAVKESLDAVTQFAGEVKVQTEQRKEALKQEILSTILEVKSLIETNRQLILEAPRGKEGTSALLAIKGELNSIESAINEASSMLEDGEYLATQEKTTAAKAQAEAINTELTRVISTYKANVRNRVG